MKVNNILSTLLILSSFIILILAYFLWKRRKYPIAARLFMVMVASFVYSLGYAHEILLTNLEQIKFCIKIEYLGISFIATFLLMLVIEFVGHGRYLKKYILALLFIIPILTIIINYTNDMHHLFYKDMFINENSSFSLITLVKGPLYWVFISHTYLTVAISLLLLVAKFRKSELVVRKQIVLLIIGASIPWILDIVYLFGNFANHFDLIPFGFTLTGIICSVAMFRYNLLGFTPIVCEHVFESMADGVIVLDSENHIINFNKVAGNIFPALINVSFHNNEASNFLGDAPSLLEAIKKKEIVELELRIKTGDNFHDYKLTKSFIHNRKQGRIGDILLLTDITENIKNYEKITSASSQMAALNTINDRVTAIVLNDIQEPLDKLMTLSNLLNTKQSKNTDILEITDAMSQQIKNAFVIIESISKSLKSKEISNVFLPMNYNLFILVNAAINVVKISAKDKNIRIISKISENIVVFADREMMKQTLVNLLSNAVKFNNRNGDIIILAEEENGMIVLEIRDTGIGISDEKVQRLFQDVYNISTEGTEGEKGVGLGLFISRQFIQRNGGDIWVDSILGVGSSFFISIPEYKNIDK